ncbi:5-oxoprolinase [Sinimarinibacterium sp. CAU 1509]|uniref:hydantoinase B/oxoprolinase family protein n=1 Tax=Sinimarinibacterium sp. CAU 1509 TaxID=2562283 RepID=UPI0010ACFA39|nr:hydantoinase B/oxoprolinase family protein [Sinimarinibacterium sp. CAU 1509]TJY59448.1 5-oxoprolinase [Sinimarinibacterium sp. CAU 1509]
MNSQSSAAPGWRFWVDRGGTFTDVLATAPDGSVQTLKLLSEDPEHYTDAVVEAVRRVLKLESGSPIPRSAVAELRLGTTVATNALLERKGSPVALLVTRGFGDLLDIGDQTRPELFALAIQRTASLASEVFEIDERVGADGAVLRAPDPAQIEQALQAARAAGCRAVAIAFVHAAAFPAHECIAAQIARDLDFEFVSSSHEVSPLPGLLARAETAIVDAYLTPALHRYTERLAAALPGTRLRLMQSSGELTGVDALFGRNAVLSGPAGGVIGATRAAAAHGIKRVIGFDMGGTSTDVFHWAGETEHLNEGRLAGQRLRAPMLKIATVAAGGGSVLGYDGGRLRVGPESAGADPGPVCYRHGGPLAVTDANLMLGRLQADYFPRVFGPDADQPLDAGAVREAFTARAAAMAATSDELASTPEQIAWGYLRIGVENMANAIRGISVQHGIDLAGYTLCAFGGAGGQHACAVADALRMRRVLLHDQASLLSALGIGIADLGARAERAFDTRLDALDVPELDAAGDALRVEVVSALRAQGVAADTIALSVRAQLRYDSAESTIAVPLADAGTMRETFETLHRAQFGFTDPQRPVILQSLSVDARGGGADMPQAEAAAQYPAEPIEQVRVWFAGADGTPQPVTTPLYRREALAPAQCIDGPALLLEPHSCVVVEPGWQAVRSAGALLLERRTALPQHHAVSTARDPVYLEIFHNRFMAIAGQMGEALRRTARSVNVRERLDFSCAVFDAHGRLVANAPHIPVHLGSMGVSVQSLLREHGHELALGDAWLINDPYRGGTHLPDLTVIAPRFDDQGRLRQLVAARAHHADVGGISPGSMPADSHRIDEEGIRFAGLRIVAGGQLLEPAIRAAFGTGPWPARQIDHNLADLQAQLAAVRSGINELTRLDAEFGSDVVDAYLQHIFDHAEAAVRALLPTLQNGNCCIEMDGGRTIAVRVEPAENQLTIDFSGTSAQDDGNFNTPLAVSRAAVLYVLRLLLASEIPLNDGCLVPVTLNIPAGSLLNPQEPAAVVAGNVETSQCIVDALLGAFGAQAASQGTMNNLSFGNATHQYYETICGGAGAGPGYAGAHAVHTHMTNSRITDVEILESRFLVRLERFALRHDSGGQGAWPGGDGAVRELTFLAPMQVGILSNRREHGAPGLAGGGDGLPGCNVLIRNGQETRLAACARFDAHSGDRLRIETPGGGAYGRHQS